MTKKPVFALLFLCSLSWFACKKVDIQFGDQFLDNGYTQIVKVDSFQPDLSTVYIDSFVTSSRGATVVGSYKDAAFGQISASTYLDLIPGIFTDSLNVTTYDSLALILRPNKSYLGDTSQAIHINVNRLAELIVPYDLTVNNIYNTRTLAVQPTLIGSQDVFLRPQRADTIKVRLDDNLGKALLKKYQNLNDGEVRNNDAFLQYFNGLRISAASNSNLIFGSSDSVIIRLYYKNHGLYLENKYVDFKLGNKIHHFTNIVSDRSNAVLKNLPTQKQINSTALNNTGYTLYTAGAMAKIRFPTVRDILKLPNYAKVLKATLVIRPVRGTYSAASYTLPPELRLSTTTQLTMIGADLVAYDVSGNVATQTGNLIVDFLYGETTAYTYDLTAYVKTLLLDGTINNNGLLVIPPSPALETAFGKLIMGNHNNANGKMELQVVYAAVQ